VYEGLDIGILGNLVHMHVLQLWKVVDDIAENIVEQGVLLDIMMKSTTFLGCIVGHVLFEVTEAI
jgi:hypothetical protein